MKEGSSLSPFSRQKLKVQQEGHQLDLRNFFRAWLGYLAKATQQARGSAPILFPSYLPSRSGNSRDP